VADTAAGPAVSAAPQVVPTRGASYGDRDSARYPADATLRCPKCGRAAFINLKLKLIHVNTEMRACAEPKAA